MMGMTRMVDRLMMAMAIHEGWHPAGTSSTPGGSRSYRHHNPGNLRVSPFASSTVDGFAVFNNDFVGWNAFQWDLLQKAKGNTSTGLNGKSTLRDLIYKWAPPSDGNDTEAYVRFVEKESGIAASTTLATIFGLK